MKIIQTRNYKELSKIASGIIVDEILKKPNLTIGFATGKTSLKTYENLVKAYKKGVDFSYVKTFNLDEYYPIERNDKKSYRYYMFRNLFNKINFRKEHIRLLNGSAKDFEKECKDYEEKIKKNPIDLQILGIGVNGHIGFNEPGSSPTSKTRLVKLSKKTVKQNKYLSKALTMGISTIMKSRKILLLASGKKKAKVISKLVNGKPNKKLPASFLKKHNNLIIIIDKEAGSLL
ncbi:MAG: glucosamine-6-phosphate deaminase [Candidatus Pacearchaeota archaeon]|nr:glucosamine-6-phosphate deaminase [Candidatus Pacearchaeota archaeon]